MTAEHMQAMNTMRFSLARSLVFWRGRTLTQCGDKGGSFNMDLYLKILEVKRQQ
jgi:hypothetical protein